MDPIARISVPVETWVPHGTTNSYVVGSNGAVLLDPASTHVDLDRLVDEREVTDVLVTHTHADHVGAVARYAERRDATVWAYAGSEGRFERATGISPDRTVEDGDTIWTGDGLELTIRSTPGHAPDHIAIVVDDTVFVGDLLISGESVVVSSTEGDMCDYLSSLRCVCGFDASTLYPSHGPPIDDPAEEIDRLIRHREIRERRILSAVEAGAETVPRIIDAAYEKELTGVRDLAEATVRAHLRKLESEDRVRFDGTSVRPR